MVKRKIIKYDHLAKSSENKYDNEFKLKKIDMNLMPKYIQKSEISLRGNQASAKKGGRPTRPHEYDELFAINEEGEYCIWTEKALANNKSTIVFGKNCKETGFIKVDNTP